jgi:hypothetical protein
MRYTPGERHAWERYTHQIHTYKTPPNETPAHRMHTREMHAREVPINHQRLHGWSIFRDLSCKIRVFALRDRRSLSAAPIVPFGLAGSTTLAGVIDYTSTRACVCTCLLSLLGIPRSPLLRRSGVVPGPFGRWPRGTASKICRLWVPAGGGGSCCCWAGSGSALANNSLTDTRSSLEMMSGEVPPRKSYSLAQAYQL